MINISLNHTIQQIITLILGESLFFVDGTDELTEGEWRSLDDGQLLSYINSDGNVWHSDEPNGGSNSNCLIVRRGRSGLSDWPCSNFCDAFCEIEE